MSISTIKRQVKNVAYNFTDAQVKVREATSNDPWGPTTVLMSEIADLTNNPMQFAEIMSMLWKRLNDHGKNWRHVYKSLVLLDYLIKCGSDRVASQCRENLFAIETLKDFQHIEDNRDQGLNVREKAKQMVALLSDAERLKSERERFQLTRKRFISSGSGISSEGPTRSVRRGDTSVIDSELEEARPSSIGEEEMQLQIALALSREESAKEEEMRRGDAVRLQIALEESKRANGSEDLVGGIVNDGPSNSSAAGFSAPEKSKNKTDLESVLDDLMELNFGDPAPTSTNPPTLSDPWGVPSAGTPVNNDPWAVPPPASKNNTNIYPSLLGSTTPTTTDPWSSAVTAPAAANDPWSTISAAPPPPSAPPVAALPLASNGDPWAAIAAPTAPAGNDPWSTAPSSLVAKPLNPTPTNNGPASRPTSKTPESFLGESSSLVNFDNLMGPPPSTLPPRPGSNPFVSTNSTNPFAAQRTTGPSINELMMAQRESALSTPKATNPFAAK